MQKLVLDTNVIVSALISNSIPTKILYDLVLAHKVEICLSEEIFLEYFEVLNREKFARYTNFKSNADIVLNKLREISTFHNINRKIDILSDKSDNKFLELATESSSNFLITGNILHFNMTKFEKTNIVTPRQFWDYYESLEH